MFSATSPQAAPPQEPPPSNSIPVASQTLEKKKRRPAGTPDPDAEVVSLSPKTLLESDRYVCEICNQGFQRDQNLQMHRRRHKVPWKLLKREGGGEARKRVFVCPEPSCLHHDPGHALGDLVGIKKHFRRKHSVHRQWACGRCGKAYAVQSDYKAHLKTCGTRGHSCDCGRVFSRVESFIEHQDACNVGRALPELHAAQPACLSQTTSSRSPSSDTNVSGGSAAWPCIQMPKPAATFLPLSSDHRRSLELQLLPSSNSPLSTLPSYTISPTSAEAHATELQLSIGPVGAKDAGKDDLRVAMAEKAMAEEARAEAKRQIELADEEFANAKRIRQQAQAELNKAYLIRDHAAKRINAMLLQITCPACHQQFRVKPSSLAGESNTDDEDGHHGPRFLSSS